MPPSGVYVATRFKRVLCKAVAGPLKSAKVTQQQ